MKHPRLPLSFANYQRLYRVILTVLNSVDAHTAHACKFFAIAGAYILSKTHGLEASPRFGSAFYRVNDTSGFVMSFTDMESLQRNELDSHPEAFHAWIECEDVIIDLLAPSPFNLVKEGDFYLAVNPALTNEMIMDFTSRNMNTDLSEICRHWYKPTPKAIPPQLEIGSDDGIRTIMNLDTTELVGKW